MRRTAWIFLAALALLVPGTGRAGDAVFQYSTADALLAGLYDGDMTLELLRFKGDLGLGFLNGLDGELTLLEGQVYSARAGGEVSTPPGSERLPFATVCFFTPERTLKLGKIGSPDELNRAVIEAMPSPNLFCAIRIEAEFFGVKTRAIPGQQPPYRALAEAEKEQVVTEFSGPGTLVGFYLPAFARGVSMPGFHWHFLTKDRSGGGHVLDLALDSGEAGLDVLHDFVVRLPDDRAFDRLDLSGTPHAQEKGGAGQ